MSSRGFTLLEVVIVISLIAVSFSILIETISYANLKLSEARSLFEKMILLDRKIKEGDTEGLEVVTRRNPDYPKVVEKRYFYEDVFFLKIEMR